MLKYNKMIMVIIAVLPAIVFAGWQSLNGPPAGRADDLSIGKHGGTYYLYAADETHWLYRSTNLGEEWDSIPVTDTDKPTCVVAAENDGWIVYIGRQDDNPEQRVMKSEDWGQNWDPAGGTEPNWITNNRPLCFAMDPNNSSKIYLGCCKGACALFKTEDGGATWVQKPLPISPVNPTVNDIAIAADPRRGTTILAGCSDGIYRSTDGGNNWIQTLSASVSAVEFASQFLDDIVYAGCGLNGVYKSTDGGVNWDALQGSPTRVKTIVTINANKVYVGTNGGVFLTTDGGVNWDECNGAGEDKIFSKYIHKMLVHPSAQNQIFVGAELAVYKTTDGGNHWSEITTGFKLMNLKVLDFESNTFDYVDKKADYKDVSIFSQKTQKDLK